MNKKSTYRINIIQIVNKMHSEKSLRLIYEYVEYLYLKYEADI